MARPMNPSDIKAVGHTGGRTTEYQASKLQSTSCREVSRLIVGVRHVATCRLSYQIERRAAQLSAT